MTRKAETILAIDPGLRELGFAVLAGKRLVTSGVRSLRAFPKPKRRLVAKKEVAEWFRFYRPRIVVLEATYGHPVHGFDEIHRLAKTIERMALHHRIRIARYAPQTVRKYVLGNGKSTKGETAFAIAALYPTLRIYLTQDRKWKESYWMNMFDAVALALHHQSRG